MNSAAKSANRNIPTTAPATEPETDMNMVVSRLSERAGYLHNLAQIQIEADQYLQMFARRVQKEHTSLTEAVAEIEAEIEEIVRRHPEWFEKRKSIPSPFGTVKLTGATSLEAYDEARSVDLVSEKHKRRFTEFVRVTFALNLEALEVLGDEELLALGIRRVKAKKFSIAAASVNLGKAVKAANITKEAA